MLTQDITNLNRRVRTRTHGGVTGKTREGLPMSIPGRSESSSKPGVTGAAMAAGEQDATSALI